MKEHLKREGSWEQTAMGRSHSENKQGEVTKESMENTRGFQKEKRKANIKVVG